MTISTRLSPLVIHCTAEPADQFAYEKTNKQTNKQMSPRNITT